MKVQPSRGRLKAKNSSKGSKSGLLHVAKLHNSRCTFRKSEHKIYASLKSLCKFMLSFWRAHYKHICAFNKFPWIKTDRFVEKPKHAA